MIQAYLAKWAAQYGTRAVGLIAALCAVLALYWHVGSLRAENARLAASEGHLEASVTAERANAAINRQLLYQALAEERRRLQQVAALKEELRRVRVPIPPQCEPAFAPVRRAIDGVRDLRADGHRP